MAKKCRVKPTNSSSSEGRSAKHTTSVNVAVDIPVAESSRSPGASKLPPGIRSTKSGKYEARINVKKARIHLGTFTTIEEAAKILNEKKLKYASLGSLRSGKLKKDASFRAEKSEPPVNRHDCILALPARKHEDKKSGSCSVQNRLEELSVRQKCQLDISSSSLEEDGPAEGNPVSAKNGEEKHTDLQLEKSGKWEARIQHPSKRARMSLGTYSTIEEAANIYNEKQLEHASLRSGKLKKGILSVQNTLEKFSSSSSEEAGTAEAREQVQTAEAYSSIEEAKVIYDKSKLECESLIPEVIKNKNNSKGKCKLQKLVLEGITVCETKQGNWKACFKDPVSNSTVVLGFHSTPEDAVKSYKDKMLKYESSYNSDSVGKEAVNGTCIPTQDVYPSVVTQNGEEVYNKTDKWRVEIRHPKLKNSVFLGSYDTAEEAEEVYNKNKLELEAVLHSHTNVCPLMKQESIKEQFTDVASPAVVKYTGVKPSSSGRWMAQISNPFCRKSKVYLGTFKTAQEAADVFSRTRREFDAIVSVVRKQRREGNAENHKKMKQQGEFKPNDDRTRLFEIVIVTKSYNHQTKTETKDHINGGEQRVGVSPVEAEFGNDIIDSYGHLVGEYSRLDDELWLDIPGDGDEFDVHI